MAKWQGTVVPNSGYVEKLYLNTNLSIDETVSILSNIEFSISNVLEIGEFDYFISLSGESGNRVLLTVCKLGEVYAIADLENFVFFFCSEIVEDLGITSKGWNPNFNGVIEVGGDLLTSMPNESSVSIGLQNDKLTSLVSTTPFTQSQQTTADKLQKLIDGKQYVIDKTNAKAGTSLNIKSKWKDIGDIIEGISGGGINVPSVSNLVVNEDGVASWTEPDFSSLEGLDYTYSYVVSVNGEELETTNTSKNVIGYLTEGTNVISVVVKVTVTTIRNGKEINETIEFSMPAYVLLTLNATLPVGIENVAKATIGTNVYLFGGSLQSGYSNKIYKFDTTTETITTLSKTTNQGFSFGVGTIGTNVYLFGCNSSYTDVIYKFDTTTETVTTLSVRLPKKVIYCDAITNGDYIYIFGGQISGGSLSKEIYKFDGQTITTLDVTLPKAVINSGVVSIGTNIYLFGGHSSNIQSDFVNTIYKFDTITETITTLDTTLPQKLSYIGTASIGTNIYLFGGGYGVNTIYKFDSETETLTTLDIILPVLTTGAEAAAIGENVYLFGGKDGGTSKRLNTILKFIDEEAK